MTVFLRLLRLIRPFWRGMVLSLVLGAATIGSSVALMGTSAWLIAKAALQPSVAELGIAIVGVRFFGIARGVIRYLERLASHDVTFRLLAQLRVWFYQGVEPLAPARLLAYHSGDLLNRIVTDVENLQNYYLRVIAPPAIAGLTAVGMAIFMAFYDIRLAAIILLGMAAAGIGVPYLTWRLSCGPGRALVSAQSGLKSTLVDNVKGLADILAFGYQDQQQDMNRRSNRDYFDQEQRIARIESLHEALIAFIALMTVVGLLVVAIPRVDGLYLAVVALTTLACFEAFTPLPLAVQHLSSNLASAQRLFDLVDTSPPVEDPPVPAILPPQPRIDVRGLGFRYPAQDQPVLKAIDFRLLPGQRLAIVGPSGAGKSTFLNLLLRFWDYQAGEIQLDGIELKQFRQEDVLARLGVVNQRTYLFNATIRENLLVARPKATEDEILHATRRARIHEFIQSLPQGYETWVGQHGMRLSGGERQRLAIARVLLKDAPFLILDEATANLDADTEQEIMRTIYDTLVDKTMLVVTHRLVGLEAMDEIVVLHDGAIVERGSHATLLATGGLYWQMWEQQNQLIAV
ncbi:MAG: thiol reductant ABC exporter subunit CydC [Chloroflexi bacterium]|nr:thiol reductant ABC exporter subunit CydC [Chloroflexota bacterium]